MWTTRHEKRLKQAITQARVEATMRRSAEDGRALMAKTLNTKIGETVMLRLRLEQQRVQSLKKEV